jgi:hypothetical protein
MPLINATDGLAIVEDGPVLKVGRRRGAIEIRRAQRETMRLERLRARLAQYDGTSRIVLRCPNCNASK